MPRKISPETEVRRLRRELRDAQKKYVAARLEGASHLHRLTNAERECAEWKKRFDTLLARTPALPTEDLT